MTAPALRHLDASTGVQAAWSPMSVTAARMAGMDAREIGLSLTHTLTPVLTHLVSLVPTGLTGSGFFKAACLWSSVVSAV